MDPNNREAMGWSIAGFSSLIAWLAAVQIALLGERLRAQDNGPGRPDASNTSASTRAAPEEPDQPSGSFPHYHLGVVDFLLVYEDGRQVRRRLRSPPPVIGRSRTSLDVPLWVPAELNWDRGSIPFGNFVYRNEGVPPWEEEDEYDRHRMDNPPTPDYGVEGFYRRFSNRERPESRRSWPPDSRIPPGLCPAGSKASLPDLDVLRRGPEMDIRDYLTPEHSDTSSPRSVLDEEDY